MIRSRKLRYSLLLLGSVMALGAIIAEDRTRLLERSLFQASQAREDKAPDGSLWLADYHAVRQAQPIEGISDDLSALTYDPQSKTLFSLTNQREKLVQLSLDGKVLRTIPLSGFDDPEAVEYVGPGTFVVADERNLRLHLIKVGDDTRAIDAAHGRQLTLEGDSGGNKGLEGSAYDPSTDTLFLAKERDPLQIFEVNGFTRDGQAGQASVMANPARDGGLFVSDLSSLFFHAPTGHLFALSDESGVLLELDEHGQPVSSLSLSEGEHGLDEDVPQAEGVTMDAEGNIYLVSEPNLFYVFSKRQG